MEGKERGKRRCAYCGRFYRPDPRARKTQKSCSDARCRAKRKRESQKKSQNKGDVGSKTTCQLKQKDLIVGY